MSSSSIAHPRTTARKTPKAKSKEATARGVVPINPAVQGINNEAERALLGAMILAFEALDAATEALTPEDFYEPRHQMLFEEISDCPRYEDGSIDAVSLDEHLKRSGALNEIKQAYVHDLVNACPTAYRFADYMEIVLKCSLDRQKQAIGAQLTMGQITPQECIARLNALEERRLRVLENAPRALGVIASNVQPEPIHWLWKRRLARGKLAIVDGDPGLGKGFLTIDLAARKSTGRPFPGDSERQEAGAVILITPEDDIADTIVPRLISAKADLSRVHILNTVTETDPETGAKRERGVTIPRDVPIIETLIAQTGAELLIIDPILGCLDAGVKTGIDSEVRTALMPLKHLATRTGLAVVMVRHLNKSGSDSALYRGGASIAFSALCRTAFIVAEHPDNAAKRVFLPVKSNIAKQADGLAFSLSALDDDAIPWVSWEQGACELHANDVLGTKRSAEQREVIEVLRQAVTLPMSASDIAVALGIPRDDEAGQAKIRKRLSRMTQAGVIVSPSRGLYTTHMSQQSH